MVEHFRSLGTELLKKMFLQVKLTPNEWSSVFFVSTREQDNCVPLSPGEQN